MSRLYLYQTRYTETPVGTAQRQVCNRRQKIAFCSSAPPTAPETLIAVYAIAATVKERPEYDLCMPVLSLLAMS